ncbi:hypothetical protein C9I98_01165 [Photobacterium sanctipauli]|uniref:Uncharacterized protein n=3 Tax=Photobacterium sanctipauli TaxID=1342794 RepID=A0A2T3P050_9GAMM|nr:hypothetical protein C9I98_01165 [Photobacterium sanctipauli]
MRKTKIMLLAAIIASPMAFADDDYYYDDYYHDDPTYNIQNSGNKDVGIKVDYDSTYKTDKDYYITKDNDFLGMKNVGNTYKVHDEDNSKWTATKDIDIDKEINTYLAKSKLHGAVMGTSVTYGGACCKGKSSSSVVEVDHANYMGGSFVDASGINIAGQNVGNNSLVQQTTSTNAALVGSGGATSPIGGGSY